MASREVFNPFVRRPAVQNSLANQYKLADSAVTQQAGDYDAIMKGYRDLLAKSNSDASNVPETFTPKPYNYTPTKDYTDTVNRLTGLADTGGYSTEDIANLRERGISPIRSIYAGANREVDRQKGLQGGYSPSYGALKAKMAREMSEKIASQITNVNAGLAENIAHNKIGVAENLAPLTANEQSERNKFGKSNIDSENEASMFNIKNKQDAQARTSSTASDALSGMKSLYGTTPALSSLFGDQAMRSAGIQQNAVQQGNANKNSVMQQLLNRRRAMV